MTVNYSWAWICLWSNSSDGSSSPLASRTWISRLGSFVCRSVIFATPVRSSVTWCTWKRKRILKSCKKKLIISNSFPWTNFYLMAIRRISFFDNFLSGGCVGTNFRSSAKAPLTFCCLQRSRLFVKSFLTPKPPTLGVCVLPCELPCEFPSSCIENFIENQISS